MAPQICLPNCMLVGDKTSVTETLAQTDSNETLMRSLVEMTECKHGCEEQNIGYYQSANAGNRCQPGV